MLTEKEAFAIQVFADSKAVCDTLVCFTETTVIQMFAGTDSVVIQMFVDTDAILARHYMKYIYLYRYCQKQVCPSDEVLFGL